RHLPVDLGEARIGEAVVLGGQVEEAAKREAVLAGFEQRGIGETVPAGDEQHLRRRGGYFGADPVGDRVDQRVKPRPVDQPADLRQEVLGYRFAGHVHRGTSSQVYPKESMRQLTLECGAASCIAAQVTAPL